MILKHPVKKSFSVHGWLGRVQRKKSFSVVTSMATEPGGDVIDILLHNQVSCLSKLNYLIRSDCAMKIDRIYDG